MSGNKEKWWDRMLKTHGSEEAVREFMARAGSKGGKRGSTGGFGHPEKGKDLARKATAARWQKR
jgi:hypothetical protein